jgi:tRNA (guanine37-N1)-methyltransferase
MKIDILTLFPGMFDGFLNESIIKRSIQNKLVTINIHDIRNYSTDPHKKVDDYGFGGGAGMVLMPQPIFDAVKDLKKENSLVVMMTPQGKTYTQNDAYTLTKEKHIIIICGHYEGFDERIRSIVNVEFSIGDYVLTGGEIPSMVITDSVVRLIDGVILEDSHLNDSFNDNLLDYPVYTKPQNYNGMEVPEILLSGHHENIRKWREEQRLEKTKTRRPDLLKKG